MMTRNQIAEYPGEYYVYQDKQTLPVHKSNTLEYAIAWIRKTERQWLTVGGCNLPSFRVYYNPTGEKQTIS